MATLVKIKGLDRGTSQTVGTGSGQRILPTGFRIPIGLGQRYLSGTKAFEIVGTVGAPNAAVKYTAVYGGGTFGNQLKVVHAAPSGSGGVSVVTTYTSSTGMPLITVTPAASGGTGQTAAQVVAAVNADPVASQYVVASLPTAADGATAGTGASNAVASADLAAVLQLAVSGTVSGGTFTLTFPGFGTTTSLNFGDSTATMAAAIQVAIRLNPNNASATVTGGGTALPTGPATFTFGAAGGTNLAFPLPTVNSSLTGGGTYVPTYTAWGRAASGLLNGGLDSGTGQTIYQQVNSKTTTVVDVDDAQTQRILYRSKGRYISLGAA